MLVKILRQAAAEAPEQPAVMAAGGPTTTYGELMDRADAIGRGLRERGIQRFGSWLNGPGEILTVLVGAAVAESEPCIYPPALEPEDVDRFASRLGHKQVIATAGPLHLEHAVVLSVAELECPGEPLPAASREPVTILTTGTTGEQKGARHEWPRLLRAVRHPDKQRGTRWLLAYNLNQFAGFQIVAHAVMSNATLVVPASRRADDVIDAIANYGVTHVSGTPTFWRLLVGCRRLTEIGPLPLRQITLGGEAAPEGLIDKLHALFPNARLSHVYAGTEFGSAVSVRDGRSGLPLSVLDRDDSHDVQLRIVDGELHIRSRIGMLGYHNRADDLGDWRPTGDLVEVRGDRIHFVGRTTEIINVGGAKVHPLPVEEVVCAVDGVELAAVYGRSNPITGQLVAADVVAAPGVDLTELEEMIRHACEVLPTAGRPRRIRFVDELDVRGSKLTRRETMARA